MIFAAYFILRGRYTHIEAISNAARKLRNKKSVYSDKIRNEMIKSFAYHREFSFAPFGKTKGSDNVFSNAKGRSLI